ncbi:hypothetical protein CIL06_22910 [Pantoea vagans]|uniref:hypothetical protein n=1 Tax=Pantoea TaxID=53335 RepID=UPI000BACE3DF|nr:MULTISPECIES: hypothetical protein [Pantoea]PAW31234.1 hypothetical protein CIL06_22910 [Pantoea vagans]WLO87246.1 hypothetical protein NHB29_22360 [Pantoea agglomerans]
MTDDETAPQPDALLIRVSHPAGNMLFRLERLNTRPVPDAAVRPLAENSGHVPALADVTIEQLAAYIADVIRQVSPDTPRADVWVRIKTPVKTMPAASRPPVMSEDALKDLQMVTAFMKGKQTG